MRFTAIGDALSVSDWSYERKKHLFFNIDNAANLVRMVENKGGEILKDIIKNLRK